MQQLTKRFGQRTAFSKVSFEVAYGEVFGFLGPNGAGKSTTVRTLGTLIAPTSGSATVAGIPLSPENGVEIRQRIAVMPEAPGLYMRLSVTENLEYFAGLYGLHNPGPRIDKALEVVNLSDRAGDLCGRLSKGLRQRVGLARTLLSEPAVMFLDEPTSGLDPVAAREVHDLIIGLRQQGVTIFPTTHRLDEAEKLCDRVAIMNSTLRTVGTRRGCENSSSRLAQGRVPRVDRRRRRGPQAMMRLDAHRVRAVVRKEMRDFRRKRAIVVTMCVLPLLFLLEPIITIFLVTPTTSGAALQKSLILPILYLLLIPTIMPSTLAAYSVVGEREQGTLEPLLTTPIRQQEFLVGKATSVMIPTVVLSYSVFALFLAAVRLVANSAVESAVFRDSPIILALFLFAPLMAGWGIVVGMAVSVRATEVRVARQLGVLASFPPMGLIVLLAVGVVSPSFSVALEFGAGLLVIDALLLWFVSGMFDRERLVTGAKAT